MKVSELIKELQELAGDLTVYLASDPEGNSYHHVRGADDGATDEENEYRPERIGYSKLTPELERKGYTEEDIGRYPCAVIYC